VATPALTLTPRGLGRAGEALGAGDIDDQPALGSDLGPCRSLSSRRPFAPSAMTRQAALVKASSRASVHGRRRDDDHWVKVLGSRSQSLRGRFPARTSLRIIERRWYFRQPNEPASHFGPKGPYRNPHGFAHGWFAERGEGAALRGFLRFISDQTPLKKSRPVERLFQVRWRTVGIEPTFRSRVMEWLSTSVAGALISSPRLAAPGGGFRETSLLKMSPIWRRAGRLGWSLLSDSGHPPRRLGWAGNLTRLASARQRGAYS